MRSHFWDRIVASYYLLLIFFSFSLFRLSLSLSLLLSHLSFSYSPSSGFDGSRWLQVGLGPTVEGSLQKRSLFAKKLFRQLQKAIVKTSFFDGKSLPSTMTRQISTHLWWQNESVENTYYFCRKCDFFWREMFPPYLLRRHKNVCR